MKVKISFTVDMEDVPLEVNTRLYKAYNILNDTKKECLRIGKDNVAQTMSEISDLRKQLLDVDTMLNDCYNILTGYDNALNGLVDEQNIPQDKE